MIEIEGIATYFVSTEALIGVSIRTWVSIECLKGPTAFYGNDILRSFVF